MTLNLLSSQKSSTQTNLPTLVERGADVLLTACRGASAPPSPDPAGYTHVERGNEALSAYVAELVADFFGNILNIHILRAWGAITDTHRWALRFRKLAILQT